MLHRAGGVAARRAVRRLRSPQRAVELSAASNEESPLTETCRASVRIGRALCTVTIVSRASIDRVGQTLERLGSSSMSRQEFRWRSVAQLRRGVGFDSSRPSRGTARAPLAPDVKCHSDPLLLHS